MRRFQRWGLRRCFCTCDLPEYVHRNGYGQDETVEKEEKNTRPHTPVMVDEVVKHLNLQPGSIFVDMTFGAGGHSQALLEKIPRLRVIALDRDPLAVHHARKLDEKYPGQVISLTGKFTDLPVLLEKMNIEPRTLDGMLFDLGCSSMQFDIPERGFSISHNGPLDMRMGGDAESGNVTAADVVAYASETELIKIFKVYGQEKRAKKFARAIQESRYMFRPLTTTHELRDLLETVCKEVRHDKLKRHVHVATKVFQALRIFVNDELNQINNALYIAHNYLKPGGRIAAITFHSLEDTIVKRHLNNQLFNNAIRQYVPLDLFNMGKAFEEEEIKNYEVKAWEPISRKVILPADEEVVANPRSRSAKFRAAIKLVVPEKSSLPQGSTYPILQPKFR